MSPLQTPRLDDRSFQDIVDEAKRLIPQYAPYWTDHNLSDPGVALIELFAWMTESIIYRLNQVPDTLYVKFLELLGIELFPPTAARVDVSFWLSAPQPEPVRVPVGTEVGTVAIGTEDPIVFMTDQDLTIVQPHLMSCLTATAAAPNRYRPQWDELRFGHTGVTTFNSLQAGDAVYFGFEESLARNLLRLEFTAPPRGIGVDPTSPPWTWEAWSGESWVSANVQEDTTGGLNRDGYVLLQMPARHEAIRLGPESAHWVRCRLIEPAAGQPQYEESPFVVTLECSSIGGTVSAQHAQPRLRESVGHSDGTPEQQFQVQYRPVLPRRHGEHVEVVLPDGTVETWTEARNIANSGPTDRHFQWEAASGTIHFGPRLRYPDGMIRQYGAVPPSGAEVFVTGYRSGGGSRGNVGAGTLVALHTSIPFVDRVNNASSATGGVDAETIDNAKARGAMTLRTGDRAVTAEDFERLTLQASPEIARARTLPPSRPGNPVRVLILPRIHREPDQLSLDDLSIPNDLYTQVAEYLNERRILGAALEIGPPIYQGVSIVARVQVDAGRDPDLVRHRALQALYRYVNPVVGGPDGEGWPFNRDLNVAQVFALLSDIEGVARIDEVLLFPVDLATQQRAPAGQQQIALENGALFVSFRHIVI